MKTIKYILSAILLLGVSYVGAQTYCSTIYVNGIPYQICAEYTPTTVSTPNASSVSVLRWDKLDWTPTTKNDLKNSYMSYYGNRIIFEAEATAKYNCHAWAWAGGTTYWMNPPNQAGYWNDGSYTQITTTPPAGAKVRYLSSDHSAITTSTSGYFSSKWGSGPRFKHQINDSPFNASQLYYYILTPPPPFYISRVAGDYSGQSTVSANGSGYVGITLTAYATQSSPNSYVWSVTHAGNCNRWYIYPNGSRADVNVYLNPSGMGTLRLECKMYNGNTLLGTGTFYLYINQ